MTVLVTGHARPDVDSCISVIAVAEFLQKRGIEAIPVIAGKLTPEAAYLLARFRLAGPEEIASTAGHKVVLVDFASRVCAPAGIEKADIIGIIDHHEPGDLLPPETQKAVLHLVRSACSTATLIKGLFDDHDMEFSASLAGALAGVILADSLLFASSGVAEEDRRAAESLARIAGIDDIQAFGREILDVKLSLAGLSPEELFSRDFREFLMGGKRIGVPHIECASAEAVAPLKAALAAEVQKAKNDGFHSIFLLLTYVDQRQSELLAVSEDNDALQKAFGPAVTAGGQPASVILPGVMNRKNDIVPRLQAIFIP